MKTASQNKKKASSSSRSKNYNGIFLNDMKL